MADDKGVPYHELVEQILGDMVPEEGGAVLSDETFVKWTGLLHQHGESMAIAVQLVALAMRFGREGAERTAKQLTLLAVYAADAQRVREALEQSGLESADARKLVDEAAGVTAKTVSGLEPPKAGGPKRS